MSSGPIVLDFEFAEGDYADFLAFHHKRSGFLRGARVRMQLVPPVVWAAILLLGGLFLYEIVLWVVFSALWVGLLPVYYRWAGRRNALKLARQGISRGFFGPHQLRVDDQGILVSTPYTQTRVFWAGIEDIVQSATQLLIYLGPHYAVVIPKRAFVSEPEIGAFLVGMENLERLGAR